MNWVDLLSFLRDLLPLLRIGLAAAWDWLIDASPVWVVALAISWLVAHLVNLFLLQRRLNRLVPTIEESGGPPPRMWRLEASHSPTLQFG